MSAQANIKLAIAALGAVVVIAAVVSLGGEAPTPASTEHAMAPTERSKRESRQALRALPMWMQEATYEEGSPPTPFRAVRPSSGEGAPRTQLPPEEKAETSVQAVEKAIDEIRFADDSDRAELRQLAAAELSGVRAEMWATAEGKERYLELQRELEAP